MEQEIAILEAIKKGFQARRVSPGASAAFFRLNQRKLEALIRATTSDMEKAETASCAWQMTNIARLFLMLRYMPTVEQGLMRRR